MRVRSVAICLLLATMVPATAATTEQLFTGQELEGNDILCVAHHAASVGYYRDFNTNDVDLLANVAKQQTAQVWRIAVRGQRAVVSDPTGQGADKEFVVEGSPAWNGILLVPKDRTSGASAEFITIDRTNGSFVYSSQHVNPLFNRANVFYGGCKPAGQAPGPREATPAPSAHPPAATPDARPTTAEGGARFMVDSATTGRAVELHLGMSPQTFVPLIGTPTQVHRGDVGTAIWSYETFQLLIAGGTLQGLLKTSGEKEEGGAKQPTAWAAPQQAGSLRLPRSGPVSIYVGPMTRGGFLETSKGVRDSIKDLQGQLRKVSGFSVVTDPNNATLSLFVLDRSTHKDSRGGSATTIGSSTLYSAESVYRLETLLRFGEYERAFIGQRGELAGGTWRKCASVIAKDLAYWLAANRGR